MAEVDTMPAVVEPTTNDENNSEQQSEIESQSNDQTSSDSTIPSDTITSEIPPETSSSDDQSQAATQDQTETPMTESTEPSVVEQAVVDDQSTPASVPETVDTPADVPAENQSDSVSEPQVVDTPAVEESQSESVDQSETTDNSATESVDNSNTDTDMPSFNRQPSSVAAEQPSDDQSKQEVVEESKSIDEQSTFSAAEETKSFDEQPQKEEESKIETSFEAKKETVTVDSRVALRQQLMDFVTYVIQYQPPDAFKQIESIIASLKANKSLLSDNKSPISNIVSDEQERLAILSYLKSLTDKPVKPVNPDEEDAEPEADPEPTEIPEFIPHLMRDFSLFAQAGLSISNDEFHMLDRAIINLAQHTEGLESVRFWGKMFAVNGKDYYIAECKKSDYSGEEETDRVFNEKILNETGELVAERAEVWGAGANEFVYYACQSIQQSVNPWTPTKWTALPSVTPSQIRAARGSRRLLSGNLEAPVGGFPRFPGHESHYLRTQIARISHSTIIAPNGAWKEEEGGVVMENDEFKAHPVNEAVSWQHIRGHLREEGRVEPFVDDEAEQSEDAESSAQPKEPAEPLVPSLRPTVDDSHHVGPRVWSYRANLAIDCGFQPSVKPSKPDEEEEEAPPASEPHCVYSAHSLLWPGAVSVVHGRNYASCYVGWGLKRDRNTAYRPPPPAPFQREYGQPMVEQTEPKPTEADQEELKREQEEEAERKKEEGEKPVEEEEDDPLPDDEEEEKPED